MKGNSESRANMGNSESRALYEKYKGMRCWEGGTVIGWCDKSRLMVAELDKPHGWTHKDASAGVYSENELKEGYYYWYIVETDIIK